jgi:cell division septal protein FtsQ
MDDKIRLRRRSVYRQRGRRRVSIAFPVLVLVCAGAAFLWLQSSDVFAVKEIRASETSRVTQQELAQVTAGFLGESLLSLSTGAVQDALLALPYVRSAEVHRRFPNGLEIELEEYQPAARLETRDGEIWLMTDTGRVLEGAGADAFVDLPLVVPDSSVALEPGEQAPTAISDALAVVPLLGAGSMGAYLPPVDRVTVSSAGSVEVDLSGGTQLRLGDPTRLMDKLMVAADIVEECAKAGKSIEYIDASVPERVAVKAK